jgi:serine/threonine-protein kinase RsbT
MMLNRQRVLAALSRYVSPNTANGIIRGVTREIGVDLDHVADANAVQLIDRLDVGARMFLTETQRTEFKSELAAMTATRAARARLFPIRSEIDVSKARLGARQMCQEAGASSLVCQQAATCVSEVARNIVQYARVGHVEMAVDAQPRQAIRVKAVDQGPGIPHLDVVLGGTYRSKTGLGMGIAGVRRIANRFDITTGATGTKIEFDLWL